MDCLILKDRNKRAKLVLKKWEDDYKNMHGVKPSKEALQQAPVDIRGAYKTYWKTAKQIQDLAKSELVLKGSSKLHIRELLLQSSNHSVEENNLKKLNPNAVQDKIEDRNHSETVQDICIVADIIPKGTWGHHLSKKNIAITDNVSSEMSLYNQMAENMKNHAVVKTRSSLKRVHSKRNKKRDDSASPNLCHSDSKSKILEDISKIESKSCDGLYANMEDFNFETQGSKKAVLNFNCILKIPVTKVHSQPVNHLALNSINSGKRTVTHHWDENWVKRCSNFDDGCEVTPEKKDNFVCISESSKSKFITSDGNETTKINVSGCEPRSKFSNDENIALLGRVKDGDGNFALNSEFEIKNSEKRKFDDFSALDINGTKKKKLIHGNSKEPENNIVNVPAEVLYNDLYSYKEGNEISEVSEGSQINKSKVLKIPIRSPQMKTNKVAKSHSTVSQKKKNKPGTKFSNKINESSSNLRPREYDELEDMAGKTPVASFSDRKCRAPLSKEERLASKITSGKLNDNFVKINLKKKVYVRGKRRMTSEKYKRQEWKQKQIVKSAENGNEKAIKKLTCFRCGDFGHWANKCPGKLGDNLMPISDYDENESTFFTLEEAANLAKGINPFDKVTKMFDQINTSFNHNQKNQDHNSEDEIFSDWEEDFISSIENSEEIISKDNIALVDTCPNKTQSIQGLYNLDTYGKVIQTPAEVRDTLKLFGHTSFRRAQEETIMRILSGQSTLLVQSTGTGKSLCYQLPAYLYAQHFKCVTVCVSPLVSLMEDQVTGLPSFLKGVCLHTQQSSANREKALHTIQSGKVHIILVSPEAIVSSSGGGVLGTLLKDLPPIAFACLDEAHCLSEWSHNFRPSYLQVCQILRERLHVNIFLGLTATARTETALSIAKHLKILSVGSGVIMGTCVPENLRLSVSRDENREEALIHLLTGKRFESCSSIIIYCTRREVCERIATFIRTQMVKPSQIDVKSNAKRQRGISLDAEAYHAGLSGYRRQQIQKRFMSGKLRIVVATVAFGMGIDKADVQGIIHYNMPRNLESYVQEIGRAGRDGNIAHCHLFLDNMEGKDIQELKRHIFANSVDRCIVRKLLNKVFIQQNCSKAKHLIGSNLADHHTPNSLQNENETRSLRNCPGHEVALPIEDLVELLDLPEENIQTLFCYLENHPRGKVKLSHHVYSTCKVSCYRGPKQLCAVSRKCPPLAVAVALERKNNNNKNNCNSIIFPVVQIASQMGWESRIVKQELKRLEWNTDALKSGGKVQPSGVRVEFNDLAFHLSCRCDLTDEEQDSVLEDVYERALIQEKNQLKQLQFTYEVLKKSSNASVFLCSDAADEGKSSTLKESIADYFGQCNDQGLATIQLEEQLYIRPELEQRIRSDIRSLLSIHSDQSWTGRVVARIFHGISSPNFPSKVWGRVRKFWRLHFGTSFNILLGLSTQEILKFR